MNEDQLHDTIGSAVSKALVSQPKRNYERDLLYIVGAVVLLTSVPDYLSTRPWVNKLLYSMKYSVDSEQVIQTESGPPSDCDFLRSPIGRRYIYWEKKEKEE